MGGAWIQCPWGHKPVFKYDRISQIITLVDIYSIYKMDNPITFKPLKEKLGKVYYQRFYSLLPYFLYDIYYYPHKILQTKAFEIERMQ